MAFFPVRSLIVLVALWAGTLQAAPPRATPASAASEAAALDQQAASLEEAGKPEEALPIAQRAFDLRKKQFGEHHLDTAASYYTLAAIYEDRGNMAAAQFSYEHCLKIREALRGREHPDTAQVLNAMGSVFIQTNQLARAEAVWLRALAIREKTAGADSIAAAKPLNNLAALRQVQGDAAEAAEYSRRALAIFNKRLGPEHLTTANTLNNLGLIHDELLGDPATAEDYFKRALAIREKHLEPDHPLIAAVTANLGAILLGRDDYTEAARLFRRTLAIYEKTNGPGHPDTIRVRNNLAICLAHSGQTGEAETLGQYIVHLNESALGPDHPLLADSLMNLANLYRRTNRPALAEPLAARAEDICRRALGVNHPDTALALAARAGAQLDLGHRDVATALAGDVARSREAALGNVLSFTTEAQRLAFQSTRKDTYSLLATLGAAAPLEEAVLRTKGVVLDSLLEDHLVALASTDPAQRRRLDDARALRRELTSLLLDPAEDPSPEGLKKRDARQRELAAGVEAAESSMARQVAGVGGARRALGVTVAQVQAALPRGAALVDFIRYAHDLGHDEATEDRYGAVLCTRDLPPQWIALETAAKLDGLLRSYREAVRGRTADPLVLEELLGGIYRAVWSPVASVLPPDTTQVFVSPDGELNLLSFATLLTPDDHFLAERHAITCVASGRDLLPARRVPAENLEGQKTLLVFANPQMRVGEPPSGVKIAAPSGTGVDGPSAQPAYRDLRLDPLPGAEAEAASVAQFAKSRHWKNETFVGAAASERRLRSVHRPWVLHLATHGFFLPAPGTGGTTARPPSAQWLNPMRRSGLALAGAATTLDAWAAGLTPRTEDDGIVTAEDVSTLDLQSTWLVVLSACESGGGEVRSGEGVLGLRRGFALAGARHLLLTLWPVDDEETASLMSDFYDKADKNGDPARALAETQRDHLVRLRRSRGLNSAVRLAGGFILSSTRP